MTDQPCESKFRRQVAPAGHHHEPGQRGECGCGAAHLTDREIEVLQLVAAGACSSRIARELGISPRTVDDHVSVMRQRVGAADRGELVARCYAAEILLLGWPPRWSGKRCVQIQQAPGHASPGVRKTVFQTRSAKGLVGAGRLSDNPARGRFPHTSDEIDKARTSRRFAPETFSQPVGTGALIGYARALPHDQNLAPQIGMLAAAGCAAVFADGNAERAEFLRLRDSARPGDTVVVTSLDRLCQSLRPLILLLTDLGRRGVGLKSLHEDLDTTTQGGQQIFNAFGALTEFIHEITAERTREGLNAARVRGIVGGRPTVMTPEKIALARALLRKNTIAATARLVGVSRSTLYAHMELLEG
jgi:DNA invertase Pin-like site-specific DNA recombinase/DNA-binding CsgD family transcriptional regulator